MENQVQETAARIVEHLAGWTLEPTDYAHLATLAGAEGAALHISNTRVHGRLHVSGSYPRGRNGHWYGPHQGRPSITVAVARPAEAIARDITRRLLPVYLPQYRDAVTRKAADDAASTRASAVGAELAAQLGVDVRDDGQGDIRVYGERVDVTIHRYGSVKIEVRLDTTEADTAVALDVLRVLAKR